MAGELAQIRSALMSMGQIFDSYEGATGSPPIERALEEFFAQSSDSRETMSGLLERASGLLRGLAEGTAAVDQGLADAVRPPGASSSAVQRSGVVAQ